MDPRPVRSRRRGVNRRVLWVSLAVSFGLHLAAVRLGLMPSLLSVLRKDRPIRTEATPQGFEVVPLAGAPHAPERPSLPPDLAEDDAADVVAYETALASPGLDRRVGPPSSGEGDAGIRPPVPLTVPWLRYPPEAVRDGLSGTVVLEVRVGPDGRVKEVRVLEGLRPDCDRPAAEAARGLRFEPAWEAGRAVSAWTRVEIEFQMGGG